MRRVATPWITAAWIAVLAAVAVCLAVGVSRGSAPSLAERTAQVASQVRCPVCDGLSVEDSSAPIAVALKGTIRGELKAGESPTQIENGLVARYGPSILLAPPHGGVSLLFWVLPPVAGVAALAGLGVFYWRRRSRPAHEEISEEERAAVEAELARLGGS